jgi:16S rRNA processing protein RimM
LDSQQKNAPDVDARFLAIGGVIGVHGLAGELVVEILTDFPDRYNTLRSVLIGDGLATYEVESVRPHRATVLLKLRGIDDATAAGQFRGELLRVPLSEAVPLPNDHYYWHQIVGLEVRSTDGQLLGHVDEIIRTGANDVYVVHGPRGEVLIPAIEDVVRDIDLASGRIVVELIPGLL